MLFIVQGEDGNKSNDLRIRDKHRASKLRCKKANPYRSVWGGELQLEIRAHQINDQQIS